MRDLLFRAKRTDNDELIEGNDEWIEGSYVHLNLGRHYIFTGKLDLTQHNYKGRIGFECFEVNPETVGQYTDVNDSNDTKIFEGDIIQYTYATNSDLTHIGYVAYSSGEFYIEDIISGEETFMSSLTDDDYTYKVIGNIYDIDGSAYWDWLNSCMFK